MKSPDQQFADSTEDYSRSDYIDVEAEVIEDEPEAEEEEIDNEAESGPESEVPYVDVEVVEGDPVRYEEQSVESEAERQSRIEDLRQQILDSEDVEIVSEDNTPLTPEERNRFRKKEEQIVNAKMAGGFSWGFFGSLFGKAFKVVGKVVGKVGAIVGSVVVDMWDSLMKGISGPTTKAKG